jgi:hypothetical protein
MSDDKNPLTHAPPLRRARHKVRVVPSESKPRTYASRTLLAADVLVFFLSIGDIQGPGRVVLGLTLAVAIPGWSAVGLLKLQNASLEIALSLAVSLAFLMVCAEVLMSVHLWHLVGLEEVISVMCLPSLIWQSQLLVLPRKRAK